MSVTYEDPGHARRSKTDWRLVAETVRNAPLTESGERSWCKIGEFHASTVSQINRGRYKWIKPEDFEVTSRREDGHTYLYLRYKG